MQSRYYRRKSWVPICSEHKGKDCTRIVKVKHPFWRLDMWKGYCVTCLTMTLERAYRPMMVSNLLEPSPFMQLLAEDKNAR